MDIEVKQVGGTTVVEIGGDIDGKTAPEAQRVLLEAMQGVGSIAVDLRRTLYMSSAGLRMLLILHREGMSRKVKILLVGVTPAIRNVMDATGFLKFFRLVDSLEQGEPPAKS